MMNWLLGLSILLVVLLFVYVVKSFIEVGVILGKIHGQVREISRLDTAELTRLRAENANLRRRMGEAREDEDIFPARKLSGLKFEYKGGDNV